MKQFCSFLASALLVAGAWAQTSVVTFEVNMENENVSSTGVYLGGGVMGDATAYQLTDPDGDNVYSVDVQLANGTTGNYIFMNGNCPDFSCKENIAGLPCSDPNNWDDRTLPVIAGDMTISTCFGQCSTDGTCGPPPASAVVTFEVNMENENVSPDGVYLGGGVMGGPTAHQLTDPDGDGMYSVDVSLPLGLTGNYIFLNGNCPDWSCKENIAGLPCSDPNNWDDRTLPAITGDMTISTCFGSCSEDGTCVPPPPSSNVTFRVDMSEYTGALRHRELERILQRVVRHMCHDDRRQRRWGLRVHPAIGRWPGVRIQVHLGRLDVPGGVCGRHVVHVHDRRLHQPHPGSGRRRGAARRVLERVRRVQRRARARLHRRVGVQLRPQCHGGRRQLCVWRGPVLGYTVEDALCFGEAGVLSLDDATMALLDDGLITVDVVGAGETLLAGDYVLVATDLQGCTSETPFTVGEPDALEVEVAIVSEDSERGTAKPRRPCPAARPNTWWFGTT